MPYVKQAIRQTFEPELSRIRLLLDGGSMQPGDLNYVITAIVKTYLGQTPNYTRYNAVIGVLECAKLEVYRKWIAPFEDVKAMENGEID